QAVAGVDPATLTVYMMGGTPDKFNVWPCTRTKKLRPKSQFVNFRLQPCARSRKPRNGAGKCRSARASCRRKSAGAAARTLHATVTGKSRASPAISDAAEFNSRGRTCE